MKIASITQERKKLVKALEQATGISAKYLGAPSFGYEVGPYLVDRDGSITVEDPDEQVISELAAKELIERPDEADQDGNEVIISLPMEGYDGRTLKNLVYLLHSKSVLLSKAVGWPGYYRVSEKLVADLDTGAPNGAEAFLQILDEAGEDAIKGLSFADGKISFSFPYSNDPDRIQTYMQLTTLMAKMAKDQKRIRPFKCKETNEKYTFRVWLLRLGMKGDEYKTARRILLKNLKGHTAFRTKSQEEAAREKLKNQRATDREAADELAFEEL